eukprot:gene43072-58325_t
MTRFSAYRREWFSNIRGDVLSGIVVALALIPEAIGFSVIAGVANTGSARHWCGNQLAPANWYAFGRLAWDHTLSSEQIADEWTRLTFSNEARAVQPVTAMLLASRETMVDYSMPLGLHHIMARDHHQGPGPW